MPLFRDWQRYPSLCDTVFEIFSSLWSLLKMHDLLLCDTPHILFLKCIRLHAVFHPLHVACECWFVSPALCILFAHVLMPYLHLFYSFNQSCHSWAFCDHWLVFLFFSIPLLTFWSVNKLTSIYFATLIWYPYIPC